MLGTGGQMIELFHGKNQEMLNGLPVALKGRFLSEIRPQTQLDRSSE